MKQVDVVLLNPPFFRFCGSHNDRAPVSLCYLSTYLNDSGISNVVYNADHTGAETYWNMGWMFNNFEPFKDAVDNKGSLYGEVIEIIMSFKPKTVVIMGGEPLFATKDWGNPFIAANFAKRLKQFGVHTVGLGPFFTLDKNNFTDCFDCILEGEPNSQIVDIVRSKLTGRVVSQPIDLQTVPNIQNLYPLNQLTDFVMTGFGCFYHCAFCLVQKQYHRTGQSAIRYVDLNTVVADLQQRASDDIYLTDVDFSAASPSRLAAFSEALKANNLVKSFTIESRVDEVTEEKADLWFELGVRRVKLGVEGGTDQLIKSFGKGTRVHQVDEAFRILKERGIAIVVYLVVGGKASVSEYQQTRDYVKRLGPEFVAVSVWAYDLKTDYRYDTQFSPYSLAHWNVDSTEFFKHLELQEEINPTVGKMLLLQ